MKYVFYLVLPILLMCACGGDSEVTKTIRTPSLIVKYEYILAFDDAGDLWQWTTNKIGEPLDSTKTKIEVKNPVDAGFLGDKLAWVVTSVGDFYTWKLSAPEKIPEVNPAKGIVTLADTDYSSTFLNADGTILSPEFLILETDSIWQNLTDIAITNDILIGCTADGKVKLTGKKRTYVDKFIDTLHNIKRVGTYKRQRGYGSKTFDSQCYVVDSMGYFYFFDPYYRYTTSLGKTDEPCLWYFDGFFLQKDGDLVSAGALPKWEVPIPDSTYYFKRIYYTRRDEMRYAVRKDGSFTYTPINRPLRGRGSQATRLPTAGETKTVEGFRFALEPFQVASE